MANYVTHTSDKSKWTAFWLCLFLGFFGAHYFYVGRFGRGAVCMITFNFIMFGWVHDLELILKGKFQDNVGEYLRQ